MWWWLVLWLECGIFDAVGLLYLRLGLRKGEYGKAARDFYHQAQAEEGLSEKQALIVGVAWCLLLPPVLFLGILFMYIKTFKDVRKLRANKTGE
jgi:hypothetical protein